ncbi:LiaF transmembrane domain-containing protein [Mucilaginibacter sp.]|uniref:LiaF transmembrane domain-containing protein n=1 Tax=Mucilaginibacter sp. TaxID=1882438 RepID=UPI003AFFDCB6
MKRDRLFTGMFLLGIGILFLLNNFNIISFHWGNLLGLWPILLIISGVNIVFPHYNSNGAAAVKVLVFLALFSLVVYRGVMPPDNHFWNRNFNGHTFFNDQNNDDEDGSDNKNVVKTESSGTYNEPYTPQVKVANLNIRGGGVTYVLQDTTNDLFSASTQEMGGRFLFSTTASDSGKTINFNTKNNSHSMNWDTDNGNKASIKLNPNPEWNVDISAGASKLDMDFSKFKIRNLRVKGGAASMDFKLGQPTAGNTTVEVATGVSEVSISVPENAACQINSKTGLSSKNFEGFQSKNDGQYQTAGFDAAPKKIYLNLKGGISDFSVKRY